MDWSAVVHTVFAIVGAGSFGGLIIAMIQLRSAARTADLDRESRVQVSRYERTYNDSKRALTEAVALLRRLSQDTLYDVAPPTAMIQLRPTRIR